MIIYTFCRPYCTHQDEYATLEAAMRRALADAEEEGDKYGIEIRDGEQVYDYDAMVIYWREQGWLEA